MNSVSTFYYSRILDNKVITDTGIIIGKIKDLVVDVSFTRPKVIGLRVKTAKGIEILDFSQIKISKVKGQYVLECSNIKIIPGINENSLSLSKNILDRQIVDTNGRKVERVNDLKLAVLEQETYLVAVDVGFEGLLRRLGVAKLSNWLIKPFGINLPSHYILWDEVATVDFGQAGIKLSKEQSNLSKLHPSDLADIIEDLDRNTQISIFASLTHEQAADVLEELEPNVQKNLLGNMPIDMAADLLELMPADEAADILDEFNNNEAEALLNEMEGEASEEIRELMEYEDNTVGSIMSTDFISFNEDNTVEETLIELRKLKPESDIIYYLYIVNNSGILLSLVALRDIVVSEPQTKLREIMHNKLVFAYDNDKIEFLNEIIGKYNLLAVPVVDADKKMLGMVIINDVVNILLKARRTRM